MYISKLPTWQAASCSVSEQKNVLRGYGTKLKVLCAWLQGSHEEVGHCVAGSRRSREKGW